MNASNLEIAASDPVNTPEIYLISKRDK